MYKLITCLSIIALAVCTSPCNETAVDESEPHTIELAKLQIIRCQLETMQAQLSVLEAIRSDTVNIERPTNIYDVLNSYFLSFISLMVLGLLTKLIRYYLIQKSDTYAMLSVMCRRCLELNFRSITTSDLEEYRQNTSPPIILYACTICCRKRSVDVAEV